MVDNEKVSKPPVNHVFSVTSWLSIFVPKTRFMMTREEVAEIIMYCKEHKVTYKSRLAELNIPVWRFYDSKSRYAEEQSSGNTSKGDFIELGQSGTFIPAPSFVGQNVRKPKGESSFGFKSIEIRTAKGDAIRIQGEFGAQELYSIIQACNHV